MTYPQAIQYLESFVNYEKIPSYPYKESFKLERIKDFLDTIDNPQDRLLSVHVAGTKGKGSTSAFIAYILKESGYKVGLYTSPHLFDFRERIRILKAKGKRQKAKHDFEGMISQDELTGLVKRLKPAIDKYNKNSEYGPLSFFEVYTSVAFEYFKEKKIDFVVLETGLGGRLDATNMVNSLVCAITPISYEHTQKLGNTLAEIAAEKAGIIKTQNSKLKTQNSIVISAPQEKEAIKVIRKRCKEVGARLYEVGKDIKVKKVSNGFHVRGIFDEYSNLKVTLLGEHQLINAAVAVGAIEALRFYDLKVGVDTIRNGLHNTIWPGRCEVVSREPVVVLDGAQNTASAIALKAALKENFNRKKLILVLGISQDKDIAGVCNELKGLADEIILTQADNPRATRPEILAKYFQDKIVHITNNVPSAKAKAYAIAGKDGLIVVTGSLFVVGEFRNDKT